MVLQPFEKEIDFFEKINFNLILKYFLEVLYWLSYGSWYQRGHYLAKCGGEQGRQHQYQLLLNSTATDLYKNGTSLSIII